VGGDDEMKTTQQLFDESRERSKARYAERKEIEEHGFKVRLGIVRAEEEIGTDGVAMVTYEALNTADRALTKVDQAIDSLEHLRMELVQIIRLERPYSTERAPQVDDLARELGELAALLKTREGLARKKEEGK
jgi:hypothetical protein